MKKNKQLFDAILLFGMVAISLVAIAPDTIIMPSSIQMILLGIVLVLLSGFLVLLWREDPADERESQNQALASRYAYLVGAIILIIALIFQSLNHDIDPVVPIALLGMVATKIIVQKTKDK
jgi:cobalamin synthase